MAKKGRRRPQAGRDYTPISRPSLPRIKKWPYSRSEESRWLREARFATQDLTRERKNEILREIEDRRTWHPQGRQRPAASFSQPRHRLIEKIGQTAFDLDPLRLLPKNLAWGLKTARIGFENPNRVLICVRRKIRREVLHALRIAGGHGFKKPRFSEYSRISC